MKKLKNLSKTFMHFILWSFLLIVISEIGANLLEFHGWRRWIIDWFCLTMTILFLYGEIVEWIDWD